VLIDLLNSKAFAIDLFLRIRISKPGGLAGIHPSLPVANAGGG
jgi:hypothetical protein